MVTCPNHFYDGLTEPARDDVGLPKGDSFPPPCPKCAAIAVTAKEFAEDGVVWFTCRRCKHTWCATLPAEPTTTRE
jgi:hypothetical protein